MVACLLLYPQEGLARYGPSLKLPVPVGEPIDATLFNCLLNNKIPLEFPSAVKYNLKCRLFSLGSVLIKIHNCLLQREGNSSGEYSGLEIALRKCFTRLKYVISDSIKNETKLKDMSGVTFSAEVLAEMARAEAEAAALAKAEVEAEAAGTQAVDAEGTGAEGAEEGADEAAEEVAEEEPQVE